MRSLWISRGTADAGRGAITSAGASSWEKICGIFTKAPPETENKTQRGWWTPAKFSGAKNDKGSDRHREGFEYRDAITLDLDNLTPPDVARIRATYAQFAYILHSSYSHTSAAPRLRIILPLNRSATYDEYQVVSRLIANRFSIELVDSISYRPVQVTYLPARPKGGEYISEVNDGAWVDVDAVLGELSDWRDFGLWPRSQREDARPTQLKAESPLTKRGIVGAFCRTYDVHEAIAKYELPYEPTSHPDRYTYALGHGIEGVVVYDDGLKAHSHHDTDPGRGQNNAFDLVRLHRFGSLDADADADTPISKRASYKEMSKLAKADPRIQASLNQEELEHFDVLEVAAPTADGTPAVDDKLEWLMLPGETAPPAQKPKGRLVLARELLAKRFVWVGGQGKYWDHDLRTLLSGEGVRNTVTHLMPRKETGGRINPADLLREAATTPRVTDFGYHPGAETLYKEIDGTDRLNCYVAHNTVDLEPTEEELELYSDLMDRVLGPFTIARDFVEMSLAYLVQNPGSRLPYATVIAGVQGCGKSTLLEVVPRLLFGTNNVSTPQMGEVASKFNDWLANVQIVSVPELWLADRRDAADRANELKNNLTSERLRIIPKGLKGYEVPNRMSMFATSNYRSCVSVQAGDRRWFIHWTDAAAFNAEERARFYGFLNSTRAAGVLRSILKKVEIPEGFITTPPPITSAKIETLTDSLAEPVAIIADAIAEKDAPFHRPVFLISEVRTLLFREGIRNATDNAVGRWLRHEAIGAVKLGRKRIGDVQRKVWTLDPKDWVHAGEREIAEMFGDYKPDDDFD